eukprot:366430-Chlamydomonas_euryale.AAC.11
MYSPNTYAFFTVAAKILQRRFMLSDVDSCRQLHSRKPYPVQTTCALRLLLCRCVHTADVWAGGEAPSRARLKENRTRQTAQTVKPSTVVKPSAVAAVIAPVEPDAPPVMMLYPGSRAPPFPARGPPAPTFPAADVLPNVVPYCVAYDVGAPAGRMSAAAAASERGAGAVRCVPTSLSAPKSTWFMVLHPTGVEGVWRELYGVDSPHESTRSGIAANLPSGGQAVSAAVASLATLRWRRAKGWEAALADGNQRSKRSHFGPGWQLGSNPKPYTVYLTPEAPNESSSKL